jgi:hypothetical protein
MTWEELKQEVLKRYPAGTFDDVFREVRRLNTDPLDFLEVANFIKQTMWDERARLDAIEEAQEVDEPEYEKDDETEANKPSLPNGETAVEATTVPEGWLATPEWPGYAVDAHGRLMSLEGGQGKKAGKIISLTRTWANRARKGQPPQWRFRMYYQIRLEGKNVKVAFYNAAMARNRAEGRTKYGS